MNIAQQIRLSHLSHGGGFGCKLAPSMLQQLLSNHPTVTPYKQLLVGVETGDDAAVWELDNGTCIVATTDFFMPMVDDPSDFGRAVREASRVRRARSSSSSSGVMAFASCRKGGTGNTATQPGKIPVKTLYFFAKLLSGRRESNPRMQLGKLPFYH